MTSSRVLRAVELQKSYKGRQVVGSVSIEVRQGEIVGLLGPNGAGKTTTFYMIVGLVRPDAGEILIDDREITTLPMYKRARMGVGYLQQEASVFRNLTVRENLELVLQELEKTPAERARMIDHLVAEFGIDRILDTPGYALSGGERRRVELARCLAAMPEFLLLDEPFSGIDPIAVFDIQQMILGLRGKGYGILLTDHNVRDTLAITDRAAILHQGRIMVEGTPREVSQSEVARKYYLGDRFTL
ncbi:MAG TPA: LPS export ABC transporter ATP-binding protein [Synergistales bacterium]|nr:LPS export ABC transporter ATP-binding protein [Synergistales bacterium]